MELPKVRESIEVYKGKVFRLVRDLIEYKGKVSKKEYVEHPGAVAVIAINEEGKVILERQYRHPVKKWIWEIPAGTLEEGEDLESCVKRELEEETGYLVKNLRKVGSFYLAPGYSSEVIHVYLANVVRGGRIAREPGEMIEVREYEIEEALNLIRKEEIKDAKTMIGLLLLKDFLKKKENGGK